MSNVSTFLWFDHQAEEAATFYTSVIENSKITDITRAPDGTAFVVTFDLDGQRFAAMNAGPHFTFTEAISIHVNRETQTEVDDLWTALTADGGQEGQCGWLKDRYGLSWQVVPNALATLMANPNPTKAAAVGNALRTMKKIDIATLQAAADAA
ncbi:VOC family protein [Actinosynnema sp. CS-041913]|uniref:VOC family protein n=1 Tax=Actinosynnema sp. CS-041913 TaxID=3239917 RepID=UPI003D938A09